MLGRSSARPKVPDPAGSASPERAELALAIASRQAADDAVAKLKAATSELWSALTAAEEAAGKAQIKLEEVKAAAADSLIATIGSGTSAAPTAIRDARNQVQDAEDQQAAVMAAIAAIKGKLAEAEAEQAASAKRVHLCAATVMQRSPEAAAVLQQVTGLQEQLLRSGALFLWLASAGAFCPRDPTGRDVPGHEGEFEVRRRMWSPPNHWRGGSPDVALGRLSPDAPHWEAAMRALETDANAPLPA